MKSRMSTQSKVKSREREPVGPSAGLGIPGPFDEDLELAAAMGNQALVDHLRSAEGGADSAELPWRAEMEAAFGEDFGDVEVLEGPVAMEATADLGAHAATTGEQIALGDRPTSRETVAHELAHVVQGRQQGSGGKGLSGTSDGSEREARAISGAASSGERVEVRERPAARVQREESTAPFSDLDGQDEWIVSAATEAYELGLVKGFGDGTFRATNDVTQPEFLTMVFRTKGEEPPWEEVMEAGRAVGAVEDDEWTRAVTRGEAARIICRIYGLGEGTPCSRFSDTGGQYGGFVEKLGDYAVFRGQAGEARPEDWLNRAEAAVLVVRVSGVGGQLANDAALEAEGSEQEEEDHPKVRVKHDDGDENTVTESANTGSSGSATTIQGLPAEEWADLVATYGEETVDIYLDYFHGTDPMANQTLVEIYSTVTGIRDVVDTALNVEEAAEALDDLASASTPADGLAAYTRLFRSVTSLLPGVTGVSSFLAMYADALDQIAGRLSAISDTIYQADMAGAADLSISELLECGGHTGTWPGGAAMAEYMVEVKTGSNPISVAGVNEAIDWAVENRDMLTWLTGEAPPAENGLLWFNKVDEVELAEWYFEHRDVVWQVLYQNARP